MFRRKKKTTPTHHPLQDKVAGKIAGGFIWLQTRFASVMNKKFASMPVPKTKLVLFLFTLISGGLSLYFFIHALVSTPHSPLKIDPIRVPTHFDQTGDEVMDGVLPEEIYQQIQSYRRYMDSLGAPIRPGMADSMRLLEEIYLQQQK